MLVLCAGYTVSQFLRTSLGVLSPNLMHDFYINPNNMGLLGGVLVKFFDDDDKNIIEECKHERKSFQEMMKYGLITLPQDLAKPLLIGIFFASIIALKAPNELFSAYITYGGIGELFSISL